MTQHWLTTPSTFLANSGISKKGGKKGTDHLQADGQDPPMCRVAASIKKGSPIGNDYCEATGSEQFTAEPA